jgi:hypothetical protein
MNPVKILLMGYLTILKKEQKRMAIGLFFPGDLSPMINI